MQHTAHTHNTASLHHHIHTNTIPTTQNNQTEINTDNTHDKNCTFGQELTTKSQQTTRLIYTNINGIKEYPNEFSILNIIDMMEETETDILMLSEINIPWDNITTQTFRKHFIQRGIKQHKIVGTSSTEHCKNFYLPGGCAIILKGQVTGRLAGFGVDTKGMGRWCYVKLNGTNGRLTWFITAYRVQNNPYGGNDTVYKQQLRLLTTQGVKEPKPQHTWDEDFMQFLQAIPKHDEIIVGMDANAPLSDQYLNKVVEQAQLTDLMSAKHGMFTPPTYDRGKRTIDHILTSPRIITTVKCSGILPSRKYYASDHRSLYADMPNKLTFGGLNYDMAEKRKRKFTTRSTAIIDYKRDVSAALRDSTFQQILKETERASDPSKMCEMLERLDKALTGNIKKAYEKFDCSYRHWWTPEIHHTNYLVRYWSSQISLRNNNIEAEVTLQYLRSIKPMGCDLYQGDTKRRPEQQLRKAKKERRKARKDSHAKRQQYLEKKIKQLNDRKIINVAEEVRRLRRGEKRKRLYNKFASIRKNQDMSTLSFIDIPDIESFWAVHVILMIFLLQTVTLCTITIILLFYEKSINYRQLFGTCVPHKRISNKKEVEYHLTEHFKNHFSQAKGTPFTLEPITSMLGNDLQTQTAIVFIDGLFKVENYPDIPLEIMQLLQELTPKPTDPPEIPIAITADNIAQGYKIWRESTETSPSGLHLSLYKIWLHKTDDDTIMTTKEFFNIYSILYNKALQYGYPISRWRLIHNIFILKELGNYRIHRLRFLHIIEAELNQLRREIITKRLLKNAEEHNFLTEHQYGGRQGREAIDVPVLQAWQIEIFTIARNNVAFTDCDAKACYDRIVPLALSLAQIQAGLPLEAAQFFLRTLQTLEYHLVTSYGATEDGISSTPRHPIYGTGQGATDAPPNWTLLANACQKAYSKYSKGCSIVDPTGTIVQQAPGKMFVDDKNLMHNGHKPNPTAEELMQYTTHDVTLWDRYIWITGGLIERLKTQYSLMVWNFSSTGAPTITPERELPTNSVQIKRPDYNTTVKRIAPEKAGKLIGVHTAPTQQNDTEYKYLQKKILKLLPAFATCPANYHEIWILYTTVLIPSLCYSMPATTLTLRQTEKLQELYMPTILKRSGIGHGYPLSVIYADSRFQGHNFYHLKSLHISARIKYIIKHLRMKDYIGNTARSMLNWAQQAAGISTPVCMTHEPLTYLEGRWVQQLRHDLRHINSTLFIHDTWTYPPTREHDAYIMDLINTHITSDTQKRKLNYCRLYLQVTHVSDITTSDGKKLHHGIMHKQESFNNQHQTLNWPEQQIPDKPTWKLWNQTLRQILCTYNNNLKQPLGRWLTTFKRWYAYFHLVTQETYIYSRRWHKHVIKTKTRSYMSVSVRGSRTAKPNLDDKNLAPITDIQRVGDTLQFTPPMSYKIRQKRKPPTSFRQYIQTLEKWERQLLKHWQHVHNEQDLQKEIQLGTTFYYVTDGGADDGIGYFGWTIATETTLITKGYGQVLGTDHQMESLRAETYGAIALFSFLKHYRIYFNITDIPTVQRYYCDNITLIKRLKSDTTIKPYPSQFIQADYDAHMALQFAIKEIPGDLIITHVKGHQDRKLPTLRTLTWQAQLNVIADDLATQAKMILFQRRRKTFEPLLPAEVYLFIQKQPVLKSYKDEINSALSSQDLRDHLVTKYKWHQSTPDTINWEPGGQIFQKMDKYAQRFVTRYVYQRLPLHGASHQQHPTKLCPICKQQEETEYHFQECKINKETWKDCLRSLRPIYNQYGVDPALRLLINTAITGDDTFQMMQTHAMQNWTDYKTLTQEQDLIGWKQIRYGRFANTWTWYQYKYARKFDRRQTSIWLYKIIQKIWEHARLRWDYRNMQKFPTNIPQTATRSHYLMRIHHQYTKQDEMHPNDHHIFDLAETDWQHQSTTAMRTWLSYSQPFIAFCLKNRKYQAINNTRDIRTYMKGKMKTKVPKIYTTTKKTKKAKHKRRGHQIQTIDTYFQVNATKRHKKNTTRENQPKNQHNASITDYYTTQGRPPDTSRKTQTAITEFIITRKTK